MPTYGIGNEGFDVMISDQARMAFPVSWDALVGDR